MYVFVCVCVELVYWLTLFSSNEINNLCNYFFESKASSEYFLLGWILTLKNVDSDLGRRHFFVFTRE